MRRLLICALPALLVLGCASSDSEPAPAVAPAPSGMWSMADPTEICRGQNLGLDMPLPGHSLEALCANPIHGRAQVLTLHRQAVMGQLETVTLEWEFTTVASDWVVEACGDDAFIGLGYKAFQDPGPFCGDECLGESHNAYCGTDEMVYRRHASESGDWAWSDPRHVMDLLGA